MQIKKLSMMMLFMLSIAVFMNGCGSSNREGSLNIGDVPRVSETVCQGCHSSWTDPPRSSLLGDVPSAGIVSEYFDSAHFKNVSSAIVAHKGSVGCQDCHGGGAQHNGVGPIPFPKPTAAQCKACHATEVADLAASGSSNVCITCHAPHKFTTNTSTAVCIGCHAVQQNAGAGYVQDNNGVRAIVPEFGKNSHHVTGRNVTDADCITCHMEGKEVNGQVVVNHNLHMKDAKVYLRDGGGVASFAAEIGGETRKTDASGVKYFEWDPANPNHSSMDHFCFSCHNSNGAPKAVNAINRGTTANGAAGVASATNPFGSDMTNAYDQKQRGVVVPVFDQFDGSNTAHHAVRAPKYTGRTRATVANPAGFTQYSSAASPGSRKTLFEAGLFVATYTPLGDTKPVADDSTLHCGDCHSVGQWKVGSTTDAAGTATTAVIGAHGSANEYMLRTSTGADALHRQNDYSATPTAASIATGTYVCYLCHAPEKGYADLPTMHGNLHAGGAGCNSQRFESVGKVGAQRVGPIAGSPTASTVFGYMCSNCHNAGHKNFGGIHGGSATYKSYSAANGNAAAGKTWADVAVTQAKPYRFMGGTGLKYNGGGSADKWEVKALSGAHREGCYNLGNSTKVGATWMWSDNTRPGDDVASDQNDGTTAGSWGACGHHVGSTTASATAPTRGNTVQRPLQY